MRVSQNILGYLSWRLLQPARAMCRRGAASARVDCPLKGETLPRDFAVRPDRRQGSPLSSPGIRSNAASRSNSTQPRTSRAGKTFPIIAQMFRAKSKLFLQTSGRETQ
jgi:hypothetical protein